MREIRVLLYSHYYPPSIGGVEAYAEMLAKQLAAASDLRLTVATATAGNGDLEQERPFALNRQASPLALAALVRQSDVVLMMGMQPVLTSAARLTGVPLIWVHANHDTACPKSMAYRWQDDATCTYEPRQCWACLREDRTPGQALRNIASLQLRRAAFDGAINVSAADIVRSRLIRPGGHVIRNGCDLTLFRPLPEVPRDMDRVLFVARLIPEKGAHLFLRALSLARRQGAPALHAVIFGNGPEHGRLEILAREEGIAEQVMFRGSVVRDSLPPEIAGSLAVVNPQLWDWVLGISSIEVLACGRPLISTRPSDPGELPDDVALLFERGDVAAFAEALVRIRTDTALRLRLEEAGPAFAKAFHSIEAIGDQYLAVIREAVASNARA
jgi:glycogen(starch) synthase